MATMLSLKSIGTTKRLTTFHCRTIHLPVTVTSGVDNDELHQQFPPEPKRAPILTTFAFVPATRVESNVRDSIQRTPNAQFNNAASVECLRNLRPLVGGCLIVALLLEDRPPPAVIFFGRILKRSGLNNYLSSFSDMHIFSPDPFSTSFWSGD